MFQDLKGLANLKIWVYTFSHFLKKWKYGWKCISSGVLVFMMSCAYIYTSIIRISDASNQCIPGLIRRHPITRTFGHELYILPGHMTHNTMHGISKRYGFDPTYKLLLESFHQVSCTRSTHGMCNYVYLFRWAISDKMLPKVSHMCIRRTVQRHSNFSFRIHIQVWLRYQDRITCRQGCFYSWKYCSSVYRVVNTD